MEYLYVNFLGSEIMVINHYGESYVAMRTVVDGIRLSWNGQFVNIKQKFKSVVVENITTGKDVKNYKMLCLPLRKFFGWLMTINPNKVASHKRQTLSAIRMNVTMHYGITGLPA